MTEIRAAGVIPALIYVLISSQVTHNLRCVRLCLAGHRTSCLFVACSGHLQGTSGAKHEEFCSEHATAVAIAVAVAINMLLKLLIK